MTQIDEDALAILACEIGERPSGAPGIEDLLPAVRLVRRERGAVAIEFEPDAAGMFEAFAAAERQCCVEIGWNVETAPVLELRITAEPAQLELLAQMFTV